MNILVTGSDGFIAKNLIMHLSHNSKYNILTINKKSSERELYNKLIISDVVFHLAGVNKEIYPKYTYENNYSFIKKICFRFMVWLLPVINYLLPASPSELCK
jgi:UDP-2-acetamido-2,6-beta-L-arabino-hexul-4-ose reductase